MAIKCCNGCVAPKRHTGCHGTCPDYVIEKAFDVAKNEEIREKKATSHAITAQRTRGVSKALRKRRNTCGK